MKQEPKGWIWKLTGPFASSNYTALGETIYYPKDLGPAVGWTLEHEKIHLEQQRQVGLMTFIFLYLFCAPILVNPWRKRWETEAYLKGSLWGRDQIAKKLRSAAYGWLL